ncbi:hypothetical protein EFS38_16855 [Dickeya undicola]|uniref:Uncharacterized protein n=1 Tax=Dickeya undicola TaxID=1577887 RepID=A0ABX9WQ22_9GAMM|nr:hypothetical protein EFS38_16855 [Dickeya undicola]
MLPGDLVISPNGDLSCCHIRKSYYALFMIIKEYEKVQRDGESVMNKNARLSPLIFYRKISNLYEWDLFPR